MKLRYEFIHFKQVPKKGETTLWTVHNNKSGDEFGMVGWYRSWRQYCFVPAGPCVFSAGCLDDISNFIGQLKSERYTQAALGRAETRT